MTVGEVKNPPKQARLDKEKKLLYTPIMINLQRMTQTEIIEAVESRDKVKKLLAIVDSLPESSKGKSLVNYDALTAIRKILGVGSFTEWTNLSDKTRFKRELKKNNFTI